jgi:hypothetical protein
MVTTIRGKKGDSAPFRPPEMGRCPLLSKLVSVPFLPVFLFMPHDSVKGLALLPLEIPVGQAEYVYLNELPWQIYAQDPSDVDFLAGLGLIAINRHPAEVADLLGLGSLFYQAHPLKEYIEPQCAPPLTSL